MAGPSKPNAHSSRRFLGCAGAAAALLLGFCVLAVIITPIAFRGLDEDWQFRLVRRFPFMADWQFHPTQPFNALPTIAANTDSNPLALLSTPVSSAIPGSADGQVPTATALAP